MVCSFSVMVLSSMASFIVESLIKKGLKYSSQAKWCTVCGTKKRLPISSRSFKKMENPTRASGTKTKSMDRVTKQSQVANHTSVTSIKTKGLAREWWTTKMETATTVCGRKINVMVVVNSLIVTKTCTKANLNETWLLVMESTSKPAAALTRGTSKMASDTGKEN